MFHCNIISPPPNNADGDMQYRSSPVRQISVSIYDSPLTTKKSVPHTSSIDSETGSDVVHNVMIVPIPIIPTTYPSIITPAGVASPTTTLSLAGLTDTPSATVIPPITTVSHSATNAGFIYQTQSTFILLVCPQLFLICHQFIYLLLHHKLVLSQ